jgi:hypothetical protein
MGFARSFRYPCKIVHHSESGLELPTYSPRNINFGQAADLDLEEAHIVREPSN